MAGCGVPANCTSEVKVCAGEATAVATQNIAAIQAIFANSTFRIMLLNRSYAGLKVKLSTSLSFVQVRSLRDAKDRSAIHPGKNY
jgi:hypothetical protein